MNKLIERIDDVYNYQGQKINYSLWKNGEDSRVGTIIFLGIAQVERLAVWVAGYCPAGTIVIQGVPHWLAKDDGSDLIEFVYEFEKRALEYICSHFDVKSAHVIADSQAVPGVARLLTEINPIYLVSRVSLLQPMGLNSDAFGTTKDERITIFQKRVIANARYQILYLFHDRRLWYNHRKLKSLIGLRIVTDAAQAYFNSGLSHNALHDFAQLARIYPTQIIVGSRDQVFPAHEIKRTLNNNSIAIPIHIVKGIPHSPIATKQGFRLLSRALERERR